MAVHSEARKSTRREALSIELRPFSAPGREPKGTSDMTTSNVIPKDEQERGAGKGDVARIRRFRVSFAHRRFRVDRRLGVNGSESDP